MSAATCFGGWHRRRGSSMRKVRMFSNSLHRTAKPSSDPPNQIHFRPRPRIRATRLPILDAHAAKPPGDGTEKNPSSENEILHDLALRCFHERIKCLAYYEEVMCAQELGTTRVRSRHEHRMRPRMNFNPSPSDP